LVSQYEFEGIFNDMILWPGVCYCAHCTARFRKEHHAEPPRIVDWNDPLWRTFQAARERWLYEFADDFTKAVKSLRPITVEHQFATVFSSWTAGVPLTMGTQTMDSVGGDFYGGVAQFSLACKALNSLNRVRPFEFMTSRTNDLTDFVTIKPYEQLRTESFLPTIHSGALLTIDALNPEGTINHKVYEVLGRINDERKAYEPFLGGKLLADVAIYTTRNRCTTLRRMAFPSTNCPRPGTFLISRESWGRPGSFAGRTFHLVWSQTQHWTSFRTTER
jgi:hypothetical protein